MGTDGFVRCSRAHPCPICGKPDWCTVSADGRVAFCMRVPSARQARNGAYVHTLREEMPVLPTRRRVGALPRRGAVALPTRLPTRPTPSLRAVARIALPSRPALRPAVADVTAQDSSEAIDAIMLDPALCELFGGFADEAWAAAKTLGAYWSRSQKCLAVPMRGPDGRARGVRYRDLTTAAKWSQKGGGDGLFLPSALDVAGGELWIVEGMTDAIAAAMLGFPAVGRSSCNCGAEMVAEVCRAHRVSSVTIVADNDGNRNALGQVVQPGLDGARALAKRLGLRHRFIFPPRRTKDVRGYLVANASYGLRLVASRVRQWAQEAMWQVA